MPSRSFAGSSVDEYAAGADSLSGAAYFEFVVGY